MGEQGGALAPPPPNSGKYIFFGQNHVKFGHFVNFFGHISCKIRIFHAYIFGQKCVALPKLTELLRLWRKRR